MQQGIIRSIGPITYQKAMNRRVALVELVCLVLLLVSLGLPHHSFAICPDHGSAPVAHEWSQNDSLVAASASEKVPSPVGIAAEPLFCALCQVPFSALLLSFAAFCLLMMISQAAYQNNRIPQQPLILLATPPPRSL